VVMEASRSRSAPALPHAYNLRQYSTERGRLAQAAPGAAEVKLVHPLSQIDLVGGNGRWRQKRAKEQWVIDQAEAEKQRREQQILEDEKRRRREEREARRRRQQEEDQQRQRALEEKKQRERREQEERERHEEEERRLKAAQDHQDWLARQPKTCTTCEGSGKCTHCGGKGFFFATFLAPSVDTSASLDFGRAQQGCPECGGCAQNIRGDLVQGSGRCLNCDGVGMVKPIVGERRPPHLTKQLTRNLSDARRTRLHLRAGTREGDDLTDLLSPTGVEPQVWPRRAQPVSAAPVAESRLRP